MIFPIPCRRQQLEPVDGFPMSRAGIRAGLACHKGNASQSQASNQTGAQTAGVAASGNQNTSNTGTQIRAGNTQTSQTVSNSAGAFVNTGTSVRAATGAVTNIVSGINPTDALNAVEQLIAGFSTPNGTGSSGGAPALVSTAPAPVATPTTTTPDPTAPPTAASSFFNFTPAQWSMLGIAVTLAGYLYYRRNRKA